MHIPRKLQSCLVVCIVLFASCGLIELGFWEYKRWQSIVPAGVEKESKGMYLEALADYGAVTALDDHRDFDLRDFQARCYFLYGRTDEALDFYNQRLEHAERWPDTSYSITLSQTARDTAAIKNYAETIKACDQIIARTGRLNTYLRPDPLKIWPTENRAELSLSVFYQGGSEGYVRKYAALCALGNMQAADLLMKQYKELHSSSLTAKASN